MHDVPFGWFVVVVFAATALVTAGIYFAVVRLAEGDRGTAFKAVSPGMLPPMGLIFGLLVGFLAAQLWGEAADARHAVNSEASSLRERGGEDALRLPALLPARRRAGTRPLAARGLVPAAHAALVAEVLVAELALEIALLAGDHA